VIKLVFWLVILNPVGATTIVPVPYTSETACAQAAEHVYNAACIPQPAEDVFKFQIISSGRPNSNPYTEN